MDALTLLLILAAVVCVVGLIVFLVAWLWPSIQKITDVPALIQESVRLARSAFVTLFRAISSGFARLAEQLRGWINTILQTVGQAFESIGTFLQSQLEGLVNSVTTLISKFLGTLGNLSKTVLDFIANMAAAFYRKILVIPFDAIRTLVLKFISLISSLLRVLIDVGQTALNFLISVVSVVASFLSNVFSTVIGGIITGVNYVASALQQFAAYITNTLPAALDTIREAFETIFDILLIPFCIFCDVCEVLPFCSRPDPCFEFC